MVEEIDTVMTIILDPDMAPTETKGRAAGRTAVRAAVAVGVALMTFLEAAGIETATVPASDRTNAVGQTGVGAGAGAQEGLDAGAAVAVTGTASVGGRAVGPKSAGVGGGRRRRRGIETGAGRLAVGGRVGKVAPLRPWVLSTDSGCPAGSWATTVKRRTMERKTGVVNLRRHQRRR